MRFFPSRATPRAGVAGPRSDPRRYEIAGGWAGVCLGLWFFAMLAVGATLLARHMVILPRPPANPEFVAAIEALRGPDGAGKFLAVHMLFADCPCSRRIAEHLLSTARPRDLAERVVLVGRDAELEERLERAGLRVTSVEEAQLSTRFRVSAVPLLVVAAPTGALRYVGGYTARKQGPDPRDLDILAAVRSGRTVEPLPVLGCAVGESLRASLNPLGVP